MVHLLVSSFLSSIILIVLVGQALHVIISLLLSVIILIIGTVMMSIVGSLLTWVFMFQFLCSKVSRFSAFTTKINGVIIFPITQMMALTCICLMGLQPLIMGLILLISTVIRSTVGSVLTWTYMFQCFYFKLNGFSAFTSKFNGVIIFLLTQMMAIICHV